MTRSLKIISNKVDSNIKIKGRLQSPDPLVDFIIAAVGVVGSTGTWYCWRGIDEAGTASYRPKKMTMVMGNGVQRHFGHSLKMAISAKAVVRDGDW